MKFMPLTVSASLLAAALAVPASAEPFLLADSHTAGEVMDEEMMDEDMTGEEAMTDEEMSPAAPDTSQNTPQNRPLTDEPASITAIAAGNEAFSTLVAALRTAGLADTLAGGGPYTVFAPTDEAFAKLPNGAIDFLLQPENRDLLQQVLQYHVVPGELMAADLESGGLGTLNGGLAVLVTDERVIINNGSVVQPDIDASNGVIHVVSRVMLPISVQEELADALSQ